MMKQERIDAAYEVLLRVNSILRRLAGRSKLSRRVNQAEVLPLQRCYAGGLCHDIVCDLTSRENLYVVSRVMNYLEAVEPQPLVLWLDWRSFDLAYFEDSNEMLISIHLVEQDKIRSLLVEDLDVVQALRSRQKSLVPSTSHEIH